MPRCNRCGLLLTMVIDHLRSITYWYCPVCDIPRKGAHIDGSEASTS